MNNSLKDKWVFITGASAGFGAEGAVHFAREGAHLVIGARRVDRLEAVAAQCQEAGAASVHFHELDVACTANVNACVAWLKELTPQLDVLVNNAGGAHGIDTVAEGKDADWEAMVQSNFLGLMRVTRACLPLMVENTGSTIINIGSIAGRVAIYGGSFGGFAALYALACGNAVEENEAAAKGFPCYRGAVAVVPLSSVGCASEVRLGFRGDPLVAMYWDDVFGRANTDRAFARSLSPLFNAQHMRARGSKCMN